jgi:hypothetical protein
MTADEFRLAAALMIEGHGSDAADFAEFTAARLADDGFPHLASNWRRIASGVRQLQQGPLRQAG